MNLDGEGNEYYSIKEPGPTKVKRMYIVLAKANKEHVHICEKDDHDNSGDHVNKIVHIHDARKDWNDKIEKGWVYCTSLSQEDIQWYRWQRVEISNRRRQSTNS